MPPILYINPFRESFLAWNLERAKRRLKKIERKINEALLMVEDIHDDNYHVVGFRDHLLRKIYYWEDEAERLRRIIGGSYPSY